MLLINHTDIAYSPLLYELSYRRARYNAINQSKQKLISHTKCWLNISPGYINLGISTDSKWNDS